MEFGTPAHLGRSRFAAGLQAFGVCWNTQGVQNTKTRMTQPQDQLQGQAVGAVLRDTSAEGALGRAWPGSIMDEALSSAWETREGFSEAV